MKKRGAYLVLLTAALILVAGSRQYANAQQLALGTDAVMLGALTPNLSAELVTGEKTSVNLAAAGTINPYGLQIKGYGIRPEFKVWLSGRPMIRDYIGVTGILSGYDTCLNGKVREGQAFGLGISFGYDFRLSPHWGLELSLGAGLMYYSQRLYAEGEDYRDYFSGDELVRNNSKGYSLVPMKASIVFYWIIR